MYKGKNPISYLINLLEMGGFLCIYIFLTLHFKIFNLFYGLKQIFKPSPVPKTDSVFLFMIVCLTLLYDKKNKQK